MYHDVHGHELLERIMKAGGSLPLADLRRIASGEYGANARYFTCSAKDMSFDELLEFLVRRNKVAVEGDVVTVFPENMCRDGNHAH